MLKYEQPHCTEENSGAQAGQSHSVARFKRASATECSDRFRWTLVTDALLASSWGDAPSATRPLLRTRESSSAGRGECPAVATPTRRERQHVQPRVDAAETIRPASSVDGAYFELFPEPL
ncbi:hypothetical protein CYMTET_35498 [Cymbomonas tetramitiformis]|uniref:Uncharacterized protein n=1 Tax=Cymbomonas tetramitiformis TaxID=36881 RepID=A0AAE0F924_9CHLO|nr:hypothetical protein CYMTET_35498 [Cymbomonas tetramitiformis]